MNVATNYKRTQESNAILHKKQCLCGLASTQAQSGAIFASILTLFEPLNMIQQPKISNVRIKSFNDILQQVNTLTSARDILVDCDMTDVSRREWSTMQKTTFQGLRLVHKGLKVKFLLPNPTRQQADRQTCDMPTDKWTSGRSGGVRRYDAQKILLFDMVKLLVDLTFPLITFCKYGLRRGVERHDPHIVYI